MQHSFIIKVQICCFGQRVLEYPSHLSSDI